MGDFPLMTEHGTFIINGAERVIVSQLVRSLVYIIIKRSTNQGNLYIRELLFLIEVHGLKWKQMLMT